MWTKLTGRHVSQELFDEIVYRDVIVHNKTRDVAAVR